MKKSFLFAFFSLSILSASAQFAGTKWKGSVSVPEPTDLLWVFGADTCFAYVLPDSILLETMTYKIEKDEMTLLKVSGSSPCDNSTPGKYKFEIKDEKLFIRLVKDDCQDRANSFNSEPFAKIK
jgi:hypothetical protein